MGLLRAAEAKAMNTVGEHFKQHAMQIFSDCKLIVRGYQRLVNLLSNYWDPEVEDLVPLVMRNGGSMAKLPSKRWLF
jgi:phage-related minor tail protein